MGLLSKWFGPGKTPVVPVDMPPPPARAAAAPAPAPAAAPAKFITPLGGVPGVSAATTAFARGDHAPVEQLYRSTHDSGLRLALIRYLADDAEAIAGPATPFDELANGGDPMWQCARGLYHVKVGWAARGSGTADTVTDEGWSSLQARCELAVAALEDAAAMRPDDDIPCVIMMHAARGLSDRELGNRAYEDAIVRSPNSWAAAQQRVEWLSPRWFGSIETVRAFARAESARVGRGELAAVPLLAHIDIDLYLTHFKDDRDAATAARDAAAAEVRDCLARSVDAPGAVVTYATTIIRHFGASLLWQTGDEAGAKAQLVHVGRTFESWCWNQSLKSYKDVRARLGLA
jgi:hypothetical protein